MFLAAKRRGLGEIKVNSRSSSVGESNILIEVVRSLESYWYTLGVLIPFLRGLISKLQVVRSISVSEFVSELVSEFSSKSSNKFVFSLIIENNLV